MVAVKINLTAQQADAVDWALTGPMFEWRDAADVAYDRDITEEEAAAGMVARDAIKLEGTVLTMPDGLAEGNEAAAELLYMLEDSWPEIAERGGLEDLMVKHQRRTADQLKPAAAAQARVGPAAARKIREAMGWSR